MNKLLKLLINSITFVIIWILRILTGKGYTIDVDGLEAGPYWYDEVTELWNREIHSFEDYMCIKDYKGRVVQKIKL